MPIEKLELASTISNAARAFAERLTAAVKRATTEADIRSIADRELLKVEQVAGIELEARHEFTVASGRVDSVYDRVIVEYKNPNSPSERIGPTLHDSGTAKLLAQIKSRFADLKNEHGQPIEALFGVGLDGNRIIFVRYRDGAWLEEAPVPVTEASVTPCSESKTDLPNMRFSLANRGSKYWQGAWEAKLETFEKQTLGIALFAGEYTGYDKSWWGEARYSVSRLTIALSDFAVGLWIVLGAKAIPGIKWPPCLNGSILIPVATLVYVFAMLVWGRSRKRVTASDSNS